MTTTFDTLRDILTRDYKVQPDTLTLDTPLESIGIDSLGAVELLWNIEDVFKIKLPSDPAELATIGDVVRFVDNLIDSQRSSDGPAPRTP